MFINPTHITKVQNNNEIGFFLGKMREKNGIESVNILYLCALYDNMNIKSH